MNRRNFVRAAAMVPLLAGANPLSFASLPAPLPGDEPGQPGPRGPLRARFELTLHRVLGGGSPAYTEEFLLADVRPAPERRFTEYSGDLSGRYIGALATASQMYGTQFPGLDALVQKVIALQKPDGFFGSAFHYGKPVDQDLALLWGNGRLLVGLLEYYRLKPSAAVLAACRRLADFLLRIGPLMLSKEMRAEFGAQHFASSYICWMQQTEGLASLYLATGDERYRKLAEEIAAVIERRPGDHVHGYLTSLRGVMDLYRATEDPRLLRQCEAAWQDVADSKDLLITGGVPEGWSPNGHRTEGCAEADWVRLSLSLWKATGERKYLEMAERAVFNELAFNQYASGDLGHRVFTDTGLPAAGAVRAWWCTLHGLRCFPDVQSSAFRVNNGALWFDLPVDSAIESASLSAIAESTLAQDGSVRITIRAAKEAPATVNMRKPEWAEKVEIRLNGHAQEVLLENGYVAVERQWAAGDIVEIEYGMRLRSIPAGNNRVAYSFGPWLLGAPASQNPTYFNELTTANRLLAATEKGALIPPQPAHPFSVPVAANSFRYAPAEYPDQPATVVLRAIAEQSGQDTTSWELRFLTQERA